MKRITLILSVLAIATALLLSCSKSEDRSTSDTSSDFDETEESYSDEYYSSSTSSYESESDSESDSETESYYSDDEDSDDEDSDSSDDTSDESEDWDEVLKAYEEFADEYIALLKRAQKGDASALADYAEYVEKAQSFADKLSSASGQMTASNITKFNRIQQKILKAAASVNGQ